MNSLFLRKLTFLLNSCFDPFDPQVGTNGPGDRGLIAGQVIPKTQKIVLDTTLLNTQHYKSNPGKGVVPSPTPWCNSY